MVRILVSLLLLWSLCLAKAVLYDEMLLNYATFLMTHNAATGEDNGRLSPDVDNQAVPIKKQLECGARALDYRPYLQSDGDVIAHHGIVNINVKMRKSVRSIKDWLSQNPTELVIMYISHGEGAGSLSREDTYDAAENVLFTEGVHSIRNCGDLKDMTVGDAKDMSDLPNGGYLLAIFGCTDEQFDFDIQCYRGRQDCTNGDALPFVEFDKYMADKSHFPSANDANNGLFWMIQAHWQYELNDLVFQSSSIILDESQSGLNGRVATKIENGEYNFLNFVQVDNVCNNGPVLKAAIDNFMHPNPQANCLSDNNKLRPGEYIESNNGKYRAKLRSDGQLCVYNVGSSSAKWCSGKSAPTSAGIVKMQSNGNLVMYTPTNTAYWSSGTGGSGTFLSLQNNRDLVIQNSAGRVLWSCSNNAGTKCSLVSCGGGNCGSDTCRLKNTPRPPPPPPPPPPKQCKKSGWCSSTPCCNRCILWTFCT